MEILLHVFPAFYQLNTYVPLLSNSHCQEIFASTQGFTSIGPRMSANIVTVIYSVIKFLIYIIFCFWTAYMTNNFGCLVYLYFPFHTFRHTLSIWTPFYLRAQSIVPKLQCAIHRIICVDGFVFNIRCCNTHTRLAGVEQNVCAEQPIRAGSWPLYKRNIIFFCLLTYTCQVYRCFHPLFIQSRTREDI